MRYGGMARGMWLLFAGSFRDSLVSVLGRSESAADRTASEARRRYREIVGRLPEFERTDRIKMNILSCAMLCAFLLSLERRPDAEEASDYYEKAMMIPAMKWFCRMSGEMKFSKMDIRSMKKSAALRSADRNPYSWNFDFLPYPDGTGYEARFTRCGICTLMKELGLADLVPAMCRLDYAMSREGGASDFVRNHTLASGGPCCDCGYKKKGRTDR